MESLPQVEIALYLCILLREATASQTVAAYKNRTIIDDTIVIKVRSGDGIDRITGVQERHRRKLETVQPVPRVGAYRWLVDALNDKVMTSVVISISVVTVNIGGIADAAAFADIVCQGVRIHVVDREFESSGDTLL
jgi:hypothetical protein